MEPRFQELLSLLYEVNDLRAAAAVLSWDESTHMPPGGGDARAHQMAALRRIAHEKFTGDEIGRLLDDLRPYGESLPYDSFEASLLRVTRRDYERRRRVPAAFVARMTESGAHTHQVWLGARPASDWPAVEPWLERILDLSREYSGYLSGGAVNGAHVADALIGLADYGFTTADIREIFSELRAQLVPLMEAVTAQPPADDSCLRGPRFPAEAQLAFAMEVVRQLGYDLTRGRQDRSAHPFTISFSIGDVRITTRVDESDLGDCLFSMMHEAGHAMYEQGIDPALERTPLADGTSSGMHESQSRLWENLVGRSRGFWQYFYPRLQQTFPSQLGAVPLERFYRAVNKVERSLIRTEADEVTYNLHVMLRFDLELAMLEGKLAVRDLPEAWNARMRADLGLTPPSHAQGVMQDIHWFWGQIGGDFQGYTLGNIISAQLYEAALRAHPEIPAQIAAGQFDTLRGWMNEHVHAPGAKLTAPEILERATGATLSTEPYMRYLRGKYGELYSL